MSGSGRHTAVDTDSRMQDAALNSKVDLILLIAWDYLESIRK